MKVFCEAGEKNVKCVQEKRNQAKNFDYHVGAISGIVYILSPAGKYGTVPNLSSCQRIWGSFSGRCGTVVV